MAGAEENKPGLVLLVRTKLTVCESSVVFPDCAGLTLAGDMKVDTDCAPASSFTAAGLPGTVKVGASLTALTVIETVQVSFEFPFELAPDVVPSFTRNVKLSEPKKFALGVYVRFGAVVTPNPPFAGGVTMLNVIASPSGSCPVRVMPVDASSLVLTPA